MVLLAFACLLLVSRSETFVAFRSERLHHALVVLLVLLLQTRDEQHRVAHWVRL